MAKRTTITDASFRRRPKILPDYIHYLREQNVRAIKEILSKQGGALRKQKALFGEIEQYKREKEKRIMKPERVKEYAHAIQVILSLLNDERVNAILQANKIAEKNGAKKISLQEWNEEYAKTCLSYWNKIPHEIRHEIVFQSRNKTTTLENFLAHDAKIQRLIEKNQHRKD